MTKISKMISAVVMFIMMFILLQSPIMVFAEDIEKNIKSKQKEKSITAVATSKELQDTLSEDLMSSLQEAGVKMYASKEEYEAELKASGEELMAQVAAMEKTPIWHTFTVRDKKTGAPISGAVIVIDGVPRFSDINGQIQVKIMSDVVELKVEKNGYNPYVEYYDVYTANENGTKEKVVYIKQPSDDLEIELAIVDYYGENANVLEQDYTFDMYESEGYYFDLHVYANTADTYYLYINRELYKTSYDGLFKNIPVNKLNKYDSRERNVVEIEVEKSGIKSKKIQLNLDSTILKDVPFDDYFNLSFNTNLEIPVGSGVIKINLLQVLRACLDISTNKLSMSGAGFQFVHDNIKGTYKIAMGVDLQFDPSDKFNNMQMYKLFKYNYDNAMNNETLINGFKQIFKMVKQNQPMLDFSLPYIKVISNLYLFGYIEFSDKVFTGEVPADKGIVTGGFSIDFDLGFEVTRHFMAPVVHIPIYICFGGGIGFGLHYDYNKYEELKHKLDFIFKVFVTGGFGVGIKGILSAGFYGKLESSIIVDCLNGNPAYVENKAYFGVLFTVVGIDVDFVIFPKEKILAAKLNEIVNSKTKNMPNNSSNSLDTRLKSVYIDNQKLSVWVERDISRDEFNKSKLKYSYGNIEGSVLDDGKTDYYPEIMEVDGEIYLVWQKSTEKFIGNNNIPYIFRNSQINIAKFDKINNKFDLIKNFKLDSMSTLPKIVKGSTTGNFSISWMNNTENNPFGDSGINRIYTATMINGSWSEPSILFETDKPIGSYDVAYINNKIYLTCSVDMDKDLSTIEDSDIYFGSANEISNISNDQIRQDTPEFGIVNNQYVLYYKQNNSIWMSKLDGSDSQLIINSSNILGDYYIVNGTDGQILYSQQDEDKTNLYLAKYNAKNDSWTNKIKIASDYQYVSVDACINNGNIEFGGVTFEISDDNNKMIISEIKNEVVELHTDIVLLNAYMLNSLKIGKNEIFVSIKNAGAEIISEFDYNVNGIVDKILLEEPLMPEEERLVKICVNFESLSNGLNINLIMPNDFDLTNNGVYLKTDYAVFDMEALQSVIDGKEYINLTIENLGIKSENISIIVKKSNGDIIYTSEEFVIDINEPICKAIDIDYSKYGCKVDEKLSLEVICDNKQLVECKQVIMIKSVKRYYSEEQIKIIQKLLEDSKKILGGVI